jgi:membrane-bound ClpP family serine protease
MSILAIILLIVLGMILFLVEFFLVPGVTIAGIGGAILMGASVFMAYRTHGNAVGSWTLFATLMFTILTMVFALRSRTWRRLMLKKNLDNKVEVAGIEDHMINPGDTGEAMTRLGPVGKVMVNGIVVEAKSIQGYVDAHTKVEVVKIGTTQIIVKPIKNE